MGIMLRLLSIGFEHKGYSSNLPGKEDGSLLSRETVLL